MIRLSQGLPFPVDEGDPVIREEGTACHWAAQATALGGTVNEGTTAPNGVAVTEEMQDAVAQYLAAIAAWAPRHVVRYFEQPVHCAGIHVECGGTPDVMAWDHTTGTIYIGDLKYGYRWVDPDGNWQMLCYLDGVMRYFHLLPGDVRRVVFMICQPRAGGVKQFTCTMDDVLPYWVQLRAGAIAALAADATCTTNPGCLNCSARLRCPAVRDAAADVYNLSKMATPHDLPFADAEAELQRLEWAEDIIAARKSGIEQQVFHQVRGGAVSRHYALEAKAGRLGWNPGADITAHGVANALGVNITKPPALITPTQAKALLGESIVNQLATRSPGALKLVRRDRSSVARAFGKKTNAI